MRMASESNVMVMVGTRKGGFIFSSSPSRREWQVGDMLFKSWRMMHLSLDRRDNRLHTAVVHDVYGSSTHYSPDFGKSWIQAKEVPAFPRPARHGKPLATPQEAMNPELANPQPEKVQKTWNITPGRDSEPGVLYAGVEPAALFKSTDGGDIWVLNEALYDHIHRPTWFPGAGGLCLHSILPDPTDPQRMFVAISTGGVYRTDDGGSTWQPRNKNVRADFLGENQFPEYGQCVHRVALHPSRPQVLFQQNHCGVYRSDNAGDDWVDIGDGRLPSRFGFPIAVHPHDPKTIYVVLEESDDYRVSVDGKFAVWRSKNGGDSWKRLNSGLPDRA